ncbi:MAG TPA: stalk domain-containing protein [Syntrophomonadaceae bacterium]|nr:stalk domain-containing protein [Syntrophomonadaceae bacterium]
MKNRPLSLLLTLVFAFVFLAPSFLLPAEATAAAPTVTALSASSIDDDSATLNGRLTSAGTYDVVEYGFYYDDDDNVTTSDAKIRAGTGNLDEDEEFEATINGLKPDTRYWFRAYIIYDNSRERTVLSATTRTFTTTDSGAEDRPEVSTDSATSITSNSARLNGEIDSIGASRITEYGFYYGTKSSPSTKKKVGSRIDEGDDFSYKLTGLKSDTRYYFRAYARNAEGISYGSVRSFFTEEGDEKPSVTTKAVTTGDGYATLYGVVTDEGDSDIEAYGFYYGTTSNTPNKIKVGNRIAEDKTFSYQLTGLAPGNYYVKAYATNDGGTSYGTLRSFEVTRSSAPSVFFIGSSYYNIRGSYQAGEAAPYIKNSRTYLPIRPVGNSVGIADKDIVWNANTRTVTLTKGTTTVRLEIGSPIMYVNGSAVTMDTAPEISNSRACLPIAHIVKLFGYTAYWDGASRAVTIR